MKIPVLVALQALVGCALHGPAVTSAPVSFSQSQDPPGYRDTPVLPGSRWRVHDADRPRPRVVPPGDDAAAPAAAPPADAIVLFDGTGLDAWQGASGAAAAWRVERGAMEVNGSGSIRTREEFGDCQVHLEFATPAPPQGASQARGNSGVFLMGRYEVQILDSFENETYADGQAAALYGQHPPDVNACRAPGAWQTFDLVFEAPRFAADGALASPARVTLLHNGVLVHHAREFLGATAHKKLPVYEAHGPTGPLLLQDHGDPVRFRNVWIRRLGS